MEASSFRTTAHINMNYCSLILIADPINTLRHKRHLKVAWQRKSQKMSTAFREMIKKNLGIDHKALSTDWLSGSTPQQQEKFGSHICRFRTK